MRIGPIVAVFICANFFFFVIWLIWLMLMAVAAVVMMMMKMGILLTKHCMRMEIASTHDVTYDMRKITASITKKKKKQPKNEIMINGWLFTQLSVATGLCATRNRLGEYIHIICLSTMTVRRYHSQTTKGQDIELDCA